MSQPPQNGWGQPPSEEPHGQPSSNSSGGWGQQGDGGQYSPNGGYGQAHQGGFGQEGSFVPGDGGAVPGPAPQGPEKKGSGKLAIIICAGCALLVLLLVIVGGGVFLFTRGGEEGADGEGATQSESVDEQTSDEATEEATSDPTAEPTDEADDETSQEATDEASDEATEEAAAEGSGTEESPYALGDTFTIDDGEGGELEVTIGEVNWDATEEVMAVSSSNPEPDDDETYILVPVTMTYHGSGTAEPGLTLTVEYVSGAGNSYTDEYALTSNDWLDVGTLHDGGTGEWDIGMVVPKDQIQDGAFTVQALLDFDSEPVWVAAS